MAFSVTFRSAPIGIEGSATTVAVNATTVATGELIILCAKVEGNPGTMTWSSSNGSDVVVTRPFFSHSNNDLHICFGYILASVGTGTVTYTCTFANSVPFRSAHARRVAYADTCEFADDNYGESAGNCNSGDVTATGVSFAVGLYGEYSGTDSSAEQIDGQAADGEIHNAGVVSNFTSSWDEAFALSWTGSATATVGNTNVCGVIAFMASAGGAVPLAGSMAAISAIMGALARSLALRGSVDAVSTIAGHVRLTKPLAGTVNAVSTIAGLLRGANPLIGQVNGVSTVNAQLSRALRLLGTVESLSTINGNLSLIGQVVLAGSLNAASTINGQLTLALKLAGLIPAVSTITGTLPVQRPLVANVDALSALAGLLTVTTGGMQGVIIATSTVAGALRIARRLAGAVDAQSTINAILGVQGLVGAPLKVFVADADGLLFDATDQVQAFIADQGGVTVTADS